MSKTKVNFPHNGIRGQIFFFLKRNSNLKQGKIKLNKRKQWSFVDCGSISVGTFWKFHHLVTSKWTRQITWRCPASGKVAQNGWIDGFSIPRWKFPQVLSAHYKNMCLCACAHKHTHTVLDTHRHNMDTQNPSFSAGFPLTSELNHQQNVILKIPRASFYSWVYIYYYFGSLLAFMMDNVFC